MVSQSLNTTHRSRLLSQTAPTIWPVWRDSVLTEVVFQPISRKQAKTIWFRARKWEASTHEKGKHGGIIGRCALAVLGALIDDFLSYKTGRLDPSVKAIAAKAAIAERTCYTALKKLRHLRLLDWIRRCQQDRDADGRFRLRQSTNAYSLQPPQQWRNYRFEEPPLPTADTLGAPPPFPASIETAIAELQAGNPSTAYGALMTDPSDPLAIALAQLGRAMGRF
jgi:hypothetical protein